MVLLDTSVLIDYFEGKENEPVKKLEQILAHGIPFGICPLVYQELLQGANTEVEFQKLRGFLSTQKFYNFQDPKRSHEEAARIFFRCRKRGITLSTVDCLIAWTAIENDLYLLHRDHDFEQMAKVINLKIF